ncbi:hypothetical protein SDC9_74874 [bioreactor metagenome]|uniref:PTS EIIA type-4 domain-containing protein n=1 Tax=bioreactor metagenome TaxID=1076179 RepID=A0A644YI99_9ZZZZ
MNRFILASHSKMAEGIAQTVRFFIAESQFDVLEQSVNDIGLEQQASAILTKYKQDNIVVFTDLYGGSVNQTFFRLLAGHRFHLITGMNLALILECVLAQNDIDETFIKNCLAEAKNQMAYMNDLFRINTDDED